MAPLHDITLLWWIQHILNRFIVSRVQRSEQSNGCTYCAVCKNNKDCLYKGAMQTLQLHSASNFINQQAKIIMKTILLISVFIALQSIVFAFSIQTARQRRELPCTHPLRISAPELFTHCDIAPCTYGSWSSWERVLGNVSSVPQSQCPSGKAYTEERTRPTTGSGCNETVRETRRICEHKLSITCMFNLIFILHNFY